jgi:DNA-binding response OmpR family regulator
MMNASDRSEFNFGELARAARRTVSRIVIADDDPDSLELMRLALANPQIEICEASNGADLVDLLAENGPFDLVVTDVLMPWMEGLQVLLSARAAEIRTPVLVITGLTRPDLEAKVDRLGNAKLLRKPFGIHELRAAVTDLMAAQPSA